MTIYWHGGLPGIKRGAYLLPPIITKSPSPAPDGLPGCHCDASRKGDGINQASGRHE